MQLYLDKNTYGRLTSISIPNIQHNKNATAYIKVYKYKLAVTAAAMQDGTIGKEGGANIYSQASTSGA